MCGGHCFNTRSRKTGWVTHTSQRTSLHFSGKVWGFLRGRNPEWATVAVPCGFLVPTQPLTKALQAMRTQRPPSRLKPFTVITFPKNKWLLFNLGKAAVSGAPDWCARWGGEWAGHCSLYRIQWPSYEWRGGWQSPCITSIPALN